MIAWVLGVPLALTLLLLGLERLEAMLVTPLDRAEKVKRLLREPVSVDELEQSVAKLLEPSVQWSQRSAPRSLARRTGSFGASAVTTGRARP